MTPSQLDIAIRESVLHLLEPSKEIERSGASWSLQLYRAILVNRVESCFLGNDIPFGDGKGSLCQELVQRRLAMLAARESTVIGSFSSLSDGFGRAQLAPIYIKSFALSVDDRVPMRLRFYEDIDLLVERDRITDYLHILGEGGYGVRAMHSRLNPEMCLANVGSLHMFNPEREHSIDLHIAPCWRYFPQYVTYGDLLAEARRVHLNETTSILVPSLTHHTLILLLEGTKDLWYRLDKVVDFCLCYSSLSEQERRRFNDMLVTLQATRFLQCVAFLVEEIFTRGKSPQHEQRQRRSRKWNRLMEGISNEWRRHYKRNGPREPFRTKAHLHLMEPFMSKAHYLAKRSILATENDYLWSTGLPLTLGKFSFLRPFRKLTEVVMSGRTTQVNDRVV